MKNYIKRIMVFLGIFGLVMTVVVGAVKPQLLGDVDGENKPLSLTRLEIVVTVTGFVAETRMTMTFYNGYDDDLEAELIFPLPEGAFVSGYALDIEGKMRDAVVVTKEKARVVFEEIERRGVDPGLVEWVKGNSFKTRIYPIEEDKTRTVMVRFVSELVQRDGQFYYFLPLAYQQTLAEYSLKINGDYTQRQILKKHYRLSEDLVVRIPLQNAEKIEKVEQDAEGNYYFSIHDFKADHGVKLPGMVHSPKRLTILWDTSSSYGDVDHKKELALLSGYFKQLGLASLQVELKVFNCAVQTVGTYEVIRGDVGPLVRAIKGLRYDGGTTMGMISPRGGDVVPDFYLLFTDGHHNFSQEAPTGFQVPVYVFSSSVQANFPLLRYIAEQTGGIFYNLTSQPIPEVIATLGKKPYTLLGVEAQAGTIAETYPEKGQWVGGTFSLAGKLLQRDGTITLHYGVGNTVLKKVTFQVSRVNAGKGNLLRTYWAQKKIGHLLALSRQNEKALVAVGKKYGLVTPGTSFLVLETADDYILFKIRPPVSLPELRKEYDEYMRNEGKNGEDAKKEKAERLNEVIEEWQRLVDWWQTDYSHVKVPVVVPEVPEGQQLSAYNRTNTAQVSDSGEVNAVILGKVILEDYTNIPGVVVTLQAFEAAPPTESVTVTNETGQYRFINVLPGKYRLKFSLEGFKTFIINDMVVTGGKVYDMGARVMETSLLMEQVLVSGSDASSAEMAAAGGEISIHSWNPDTPYVQKLKAAPRAEVYALYLQLKKQYGNTPGFFLDCAAYFFTLGKKHTALRVLSNIVELHIEDAAFLRIVAQRLAQLGYYRLSAELFTEVLHIRPEEPQSYRDLALVLVQLGQYRQAALLLYQVILKRWDERFLGIENIVLMELNHLLVQAQQKGLPTASWGIDKRLVRLLDVDIRIVLTWDTDLSDMDLWIIEPSGEKTFYGHQLSTIGGHLSDDFTGGLGPEEYLLKRSVPGVFKIKANYYGERSVDILAPVTLHVDIFTDYGRKTEKRKALTLQLATKKEVCEIGEVTF